MTTRTLTVVGRALPELAAEIRTEIAAADHDWHSALAHAVRVGELLREAKAACKHGTWLPWLEGNFPESRRSAQAYMRLAANAQSAAYLEEGLSVNAALKLLAQPKRDRERDRERAEDAERIATAKCGACGRDRAEREAAGMALASALWELSLCTECHHKHKREEAQQQQREWAALRDDERQQRLDAAAREQAAMAGLRGYDALRMLSEEGGVFAAIRGTLGALQAIEEPDAELHEAVVRVAREIENAAHELWRWADPDVPSREEAEAALSEWTDDVCLDMIGELDDAATYQARDGLRQFAKYLPELLPDQAAAWEQMLTNHYLHRREEAHGIAPRTRAPGVAVPSGPDVPESDPLAELASRFCQCDPPPTATNIDEGRHIQCGKPIVGVLPEVGE
jgi:hypothetical protein